MRKENPFWSGWYQCCQKCYWHKDVHVHVHVHEYEDVDGKINSE